MKLSKKERDVIVRLLRTAASDAARLARETYERTGDFTPTMAASKHEQWLLELADKVGAEGGG